MPKKLITKDYNGFIFDTLKYPVEDFQNLFVEFVEENLKYNPDIIERLFDAINNWIDWYFRQIYAVGGETFLVNANGQEVKYDLRETLIPLPPEFGIKRHINRSLFDEQLRQLENIQEAINLKNKMISFYNALPKEYQEQIGKDFIPRGIYFEDLKEAMEKMQRISFEAPALKQKLTTKEVGLKCFYEGLQVTRENGDEIAKRYGHTSGEAIYQGYTHYSSKANRRGKEDTPERMKNKIKRIEKVLCSLPEDKKSLAVDELKLLKTLLETGYN